MGSEVKLCLKQQVLAGCLRMDSANSRAEGGWEGKGSLREEFTTLPG